MTISFHDTSKTPILIKATATKLTPSPSQHQRHQNQSDPLRMLFSFNKIRESLYKYIYIILVNLEWNLFINWSIFGNNLDEWILYSFNFWTQKVLRSGQYYYLYTYLFCFVKPDLIMLFVILKSKCTVICNRNPSIYILPLASNERQHLLVRHFSHQYILN